MREKKKKGNNANHTIALMREKKKKGTMQTIRLHTVDARKEGKRSNTNHTIALIRETMKYELSTKKNVTYCNQKKSNRK